MNDEQLTKTLQDIAEERISPDMDLWKDIQTQLETTPDNVRRFRKYRNRWLLVAIVAIMALGVVGVLAQGGGEPDPRDPGLRAADEQGLVTYFEETQTIDNISVTLEYVYADANRVSTSFTAEAELPADDDGFVYFESSLATDADVTLTNIFGGGGGGVGGGGGGGPTDAPDATAVKVQRSASQNNYDVFSNAELPDELDLTLTIVARKAAPGSADSMAPRTNPATDEVVATFTYEVTVPVYTGKQLPEPQTVSAHDVEITLQDVVVTTTMTRVVLCFEAPPPTTSNFPWAARPQLAIGEDVVVAEQAVWGQMPPLQVAESFDDDCTVLFLTESLLGQEGTWTLTIPALVAPVPVSQDALRTILEAEYDVEVVEDPNGGTRFEGAAPEEIGQYITEINRANEERLEGPWVFEFILD